MRVPVAARAVKRHENEEIMGTERTPPLSTEGSREVEEEMRRPPADTPERRRMSALLRDVRESLKRRAEAEKDSGE